MNVSQLAEWIARQRDSGRAYLEFLRVPSLSLGIYSLPAGSIDSQQPHTEDEIYLISSGRGSIQIGTEDHLVQPGSLVYVPAGVEHRFHSIAEDLTTLVFFAPAEYTQAAQR
jgi:mannose-6-phosphate isomerase-like protein (cupin superfamily)